MWRQILHRAPFRPPVVERFAFTMGQAFNFKTNSPSEKSLLQKVFGLGEKTVSTALGGAPNSLGKLGGNQWDALRASHALGASVSFSTKLEPPLGIEPRTFTLQKCCSTN